MDPTKLTHVTAALSDIAPSTDIVNMRGGEECLAEEEKEEVREDVRESEWRHGENVIAEDEI